MAALPPPLSASPLDMGQIPMGEMPMPPSGGSRLGALKPIGPSAGAGGGRPPPAMPPRPISRMPAEVPVVENRGEEFANKILDRKDATSNRIRETGVRDRRMEGYNRAKEERTAIRDIEKAKAIAETQRLQKIQDATLQQETERLRADLPGGSADRQKLSEKQLDLSTAQVGLNANIAVLQLQRSLEGDKVNIEKLMEATQRKEQLLISISAWKQANDANKTSSLWANVFGADDLTDPSDDLEGLLEAFARSKSYPLATWKALQAEGVTTKELADFHWAHPTAHGAQVKMSIENASKDAEEAIQKASMAAASMETLDLATGRVAKEEIQNIIRSLGPLRSFGSDAMNRVRDSVFGAGQPQFQPDPAPTGQDPLTRPPVANPITGGGFPDTDTDPNTDTDPSAAVPDPKLPNIPSPEDLAAQQALGSPTHPPTLSNREMYDDTLILETLAGWGANAVEKFSDFPGLLKKYGDIVLAWDEYPDEVKMAIIAGGGAAGSLLFSRADTTSIPRPGPLLSKMWDKAVAAKTKVGDLASWWKKEATHPTVAADVKKLQQSLQGVQKANPAAFGKGASVAPGQYPATTAPTKDITVGQRPVATNIKNAGVTVPPRTGDGTTSARSAAELIKPGSGARVVEPKTGLASKTTYAPVEPALPKDSWYKNRGPGGKVITELADHGPGSKQPFVHPRDPNLAARGAVWMDGSGPDVQGSRASAQLQTSTAQLSKIAELSHTYGVKPWEGSKAEKAFKDTATGFRSRTELSAKWQYYHDELGKLSKKNWEKISPKTRKLLETQAATLAKENARIREAKYKALDAEGKKAHDTSKKAMKEALETAEKPKPGKLRSSTQWGMKVVTAGTAALLTHDLIKLWQNVEEKRMTPKDQAAFKAFTEAQYAKQDAAQEILDSGVVELIEKWRAKGVPDESILSQFRDGAAKGFVQQDGAKISQAHVDSAEEYMAGVDNVDDWDFDQGSATPAPPPAPPPTPPSTPGANIAPGPPQVDPFAPPTPITSGPPPLPGEKLKEERDQLVQRIIELKETISNWTSTANSPSFSEMELKEAEGMLAEVDAALKAGEDSAP